MRWITSFLVATTAGKAVVFVCPMFVDPVAQSGSEICVAEGDGALQQHHYPHQDQQSWFLSLKLKPEPSSSQKLCNRFSSRAKSENY